MKYCWLTIFVLFRFLAGMIEGIDPGKQLVSDVLANCSRSLRPVLDVNKQIIVGVEFEINQINSLDVVDQVEKIPFGLFWFKRRHNITAIFVFAVFQFFNEIFWIYFEINFSYNNVFLKYCKTVSIFTVYKSCRTPKLKKDILKYQRVTFCTLWTKLIAKIGSIDNWAISNPPPPPPPRPISA